MTSEKKLKLPVTTFSHSVELEARRILHTAGSLARGWHQKHNFLIVPQQLPKAPTSQVIFPNLAYDSIPNFWDQVSKLPLATPMIAPKALLEATVNLIAPHYNTSQYDKHLESLKGSWNKVESNFWSNLHTLFPSYNNYISKVNIHSTQYGPHTTFSLADKQHSEITIFVRQDSSIDRLLWTLLTCLFRPKMMTEMKISWEEMEATVDWLMAESSLNCGYKPTHPTIKNLRAEQLAKYRRESDDYLNHLGLSGVLKLQKNGSEYLYGDIVITTIPTKERLLLDLLLSNRGSTVTFEQIANVLWPGKEDWTLYAIVKCVERLRRHFKSTGIMTPLIHAHRRVGYSIAN